jgi:hypothetical protein
VQRFPWCKNTLLEPATLSNPTETQQKQFSITKTNKKITILANKTNIAQLITHIIEQTPNTPHANIIFNIVQHKEIKLNIKYIESMPI